MPKIKAKHIANFFGTWFDIRSMPEGVEVKVDGKFYTFTFTSDEGTFTVGESYNTIGHALTEDEVKILESVLNKTPGLYDKFMKSLEQKANDKTWKIFANSEAPGGVDTYIYMSSRIVKQEELAGEMFKITRDYHKNIGHETSNMERMSVWTLKDFLDNHALENPDVELRIQSSVAFEESFDRVRFWANAAWDKIITSGVKPMDEMPIEWLEDDSMFAKSDGFFEDVIKDANNQCKKVQQASEAAAQKATVDLNDPAFQSDIGKKVKSKANSDLVVKVSEALVSILKGMKEVDKCTREEAKKLKAEIEAVQKCYEQAEHDARAEVANSFYNPEPENKDEMEAKADAAMEALLASWS